MIRYVHTYVPDLDLFGCMVAQDNGTLQRETARRDTEIKVFR